MFEMTEMHSLKFQSHLYFLRLTLFYSIVIRKKAIFLKVFVSSPQWDFVQGKLYWKETWANNQELTAFSLFPGIFKLFYLVSSTRHKLSLICHFLCSNFVSHAWNSPSWNRFQPPSLSLTKVYYYSQTWANDHFRIVTTILVSQFRSL